MGGHQSRALGLGAEWDHEQTQWAKSHSIEVNEEKAKLQLEDIEKFSAGKLDLRMCTTE